jgi:putative SOS response-associated peptidase YedK
MCGRYGVILSSKAYADLFGTGIEEWLDEPKWQAAPDQKLPVVNSDKKIVLNQWGFKPSWVKPGGKRYAMINARKENILQSPTYRKALEKRRVAVCADSFYEWKPTDEGKQPYRILLKNEQPFAFAGIGQDHADSGDVDRFSIVTTDANAVVEPIHPRMPVMLNAEEVQRWLDPDAEPEEIMALLRPYNAEEMKAYPVSKAVNNSRYNNPEIIKPIMNSE